MRRGLAVGLSLWAGCALALAETPLRPFHVEMPGQLAPSAFKIRGMKGWAWLPEQYLSEIPVMAKYRMNFLMNCYSSLWELGERGAWVRDRPMNFWHRPLPEERRRGFEEVVKACKHNGIEFCFSVNPNLLADRPFDYDSPADLEALWRHYAWMQGLGVKWFNLSLDDIETRFEAEGQARLLNEILKRLRARDPEAKLVFCPTWYAGTGEAKIETSHRLGNGDTPGHRYTHTLAEKLDPEIYLFWTGSEVGPLTITREDARKYRALVRHKLILWDNYPVNDQTPALHLAPLTGRDPRLSEVLDGYIGNPMSFEVEANRIPMLTIADYAANPRGYDAGRSIGWAIRELAPAPEQQEALKHLVELYPGRFWDGSQSTAWNSVRERFHRALKSGERAEAEKLAERTAAVAGQLGAAFPGRYLATRRLLDADVRLMRQELGR